MPIYEYNGNRYELDDGLSPDEALKIIEEHENAQRKPAESVAPSTSNKDRDQSVGRFITDPAYQKYNPDWVDASRKVWARENPGVDPKSINDADVAQYGISRMRWLNNNIAKLGIDAASMSRATLEERKAFLYLMEKYDDTDYSVAGAVDAVVPQLTDPFNWIGIGSLGAGLLGKATAKVASKKALQEALRYGIQGAIEAGIANTADDALRQKIEKDAGAREAYDPVRGAGAAATGAGVGFALGAGGSAVADAVPKAVRKFREDFGIGEEAGKVADDAAPSNAAPSPSEAPVAAPEAVAEAPKAPPAPTPPQKPAKAYPQVDPNIARRTLPEALPEGTDVTPEQLIAVGGTPYKPKPGPSGKIGNEAALTQPVNNERYRQIIAEREAKYGRETPLVDENGWLRELNPKERITPEEIEALGGQPHVDPQAQPFAHPHWKKKLADMEAQNTELYNRLRIAQKAQGEAPAGTGISEGPLRLSRPPKGSSTDTSIPYHEMLTRMGIDGVVDPKTLEGAAASVHWSKNRDLYDETVVKFAMDRLERGESIDEPFMSPNGGHEIKLTPGHRSRIDQLLKQENPLLTTVEKLASKVGFDGVPRSTEEVIATAKAIVNRLKNVTPEQVEKFIREVEAKATTGTQSTALKRDIEEVTEALLKAVAKLGDQASNPDNAALVELAERMRKLDLSASSNSGRELGSRAGLLNTGEFRDISPESYLLSKGIDPALATEAQRKEALDWYQQQLVKRVEEVEKAEAIQILTRRIDDAWRGDDPSSAIKLMGEREAKKAELAGKLDAKYGEGWWKKTQRLIAEVAISNVFSTKTLVMNTLPTVAKTVYEPALNAVARGALSPTSWRIAGAQYAAMANGTKTAFRAGVAAFRYERNLLAGNISEIATDPMIPGLTGNVVRLIPKALNASDEFMSQIVYRSFVAGDAAARFYEEAAEKGLKGEARTAFVQKQMAEYMDKAFSQVPDSSVLDFLYQQGTRRGLSGDKLEQWMKTELYN
ncbi:hypothetical protein WDZ92_22445, partial [Nostoc sp. NIES-2111]